MKKVFLVSTFIIYSLLSVNAQWVGTNPVTTNSNVVVGTSNNNMGYKINIPGNYNFEQVNLGQFGNGASGLEFINHNDLSQSYGVKLLTNVDAGLSGLQIQTANPATTYAGLTYSTKLAIHSGGNIGIGTITPSCLLDIYKSDNPTLKIASDNWSGYGNPSILLNRGTEQTLKIEAYPNVEGRFSTVVANSGFMTFYTGENKERMRIANTGNVGIGLIDPSEKLEVYNSDILPGVLSLRSNRNDAQNVEVGKISAKQGTTEVTRIGMLRGAETTSGYFTFWTKNNNAATLTEKMRIDGAGNVGIGNTAPKNKLSVKGSANVEIGQYTVSTPTTINYGAIGFNNTAALSTSNYALAGTNALTVLNAPTASGQIKFKINDVEKMSINSNGNVGIGVSGAATQKLDVNGAISLGSTNVNSNNTKLFLKNPGTPWQGDPGGKTWAISSGANNVGESKFAIYNWTDHSNDFQSYFSISHDGKVGIGNNNPSSKLDIQVPHVSNQSDAIRIGSYTTQSNVAGSYGLGMRYALDGGGGPKGFLSVYSAPGAVQQQIDAMSFNVWNGNVGIGTANPLDDSKLTVNGKITAKEVEIKDVAADFVFQKDYQLKPLHEVESFINENKHLPGVAPASETVKGVELSKFNTLLLQKVEELTLYMIQLKKENEEMKAQISAISKK